MNTASDREMLESAAVAWLARREEPSWTDTDQAALERWLDSSPGHRVAFIRCQSFWHTADRLKSLRAGFPGGEVPTREAIEQLPLFKQRLIGLLPDVQVAGETAQTTRSRRVPLSAAAVLLAIGIGLVGVYLSGALSGRSTYRTALGGLSTVPLQDGSTVILNTDTEIEVRLDSAERRIVLKKGEAFFEVAKDPSRPFTVYAAQQRVTALGTQFSVRVGGNEMPVTVAVTEGKVLLDGRSTLFSEARVPQTASAGDVARMDNERVEVERRSSSAIEQTLSWRKGYVVLDNRPLADAVAEFNRYNARQLVIEDPMLEGIRIEGNFRATNIDGFVRLLERGFGVDARDASDGRILLRRPGPQ